MLLLAGLATRRLFDRVLRDYDRVRWIEEGGGHVTRRGDELLVEWRGHTIVCRRRSSDLDAALQCLFGQQYAVLPPGPPPATVVDLGANVGCASVYFADAFPTARIVAVEPDAANYALARRNLTPFGSRVSVVNGAIWDSDSGVSMQGGHSPKDAWSRSVVSGGTTEGITVPSLMRRFELSRIDVLKVDVEGAETRLFQGAPDWISAVGVCAIELHGAEATRTVAEAFTRHGRRELLRVGEVAVFG